MRHLAIDMGKVEPKPLYQPRLAKLVQSKQWTELEKLLVFELTDGEPLGHSPGQFVEVSVYGVGEAPISVSSAPAGDARFEICVRKVGNVTAALHNLSEGDVVGVRGPFGRGFPVEELKGKNLLFIGGGIGMVPLRSFINYALEHKGDYGRLTVLYGCKNPGEFLFHDELERWRGETEYHETVDSAAGMEWCCEVAWNRCEGVITVLIPPLEFDPADTYAIVVGPPIMYRFVLRSLKDKKMPDDHIIVSLERRMKCGVGICGHCQIGPLYTCQDGPVFYYSEIKGIKEAL